MSLAWPVRLRERSGAGARIESMARRCLATVAGTWHVTVSASETVAHWWVVDLLRGEDGFRRTFFVSGGREPEGEVCGRVASVLRRAVQEGFGWAATTLPCGTSIPPDVANNESGVEIDVNASLARELRERFEAGVRQVFEERSGSYRVRVEPGRSEGEVVLLVTSARRPLPLPLFFPNARMLDAADVARILANVLEGMGPAFRC